jgi:hypothetical protein
MSTAEQAHADMLDAADDLAVALESDRPTALRVMATVFERAAGSGWFSPIARVDLATAAALADTLAWIDDGSLDTRSQSDDREAATP